MRRDAAKMAVYVLFVNTGFYRLRLDGGRTRPKGEEFKGGENLRAMKLGDSPSA